jgi:hypothetical protein
VFTEFFASLVGNIKLASPRKNGKMPHPEAILCGQLPGSAFTGIGLRDGGSPQVKHDISEKLNVVRGPPGTESGV